MLRYLDTFCAVARHGTFAAAGDRLGLSQSAVSIQMRRLEQELGVALFERSGRNAVLSEAGRRALVQAERILQLYGQMAQGVADANVAGVLRAGAISTELLGGVVDALGRFRARFPKVEVQLLPGSSVELMALVEKQRLDCALIVKPAYPLGAALDWKSLRSEPFVLIAGPDEGCEDVGWLLAHRPFLRYDRASHGGSLVERFLRRKKYQVRESVETDSIEAIGLLVARGAGVAIVPRTRALAVLGTCLRELDLGGDRFYREVGMVERIDNPRAHLNGDFWRVLADPTPA